MNLILIQSHEIAPSGEVRLQDKRAEHIRRVLKAVPGKVLRIGLLNGPLGRGVVTQVGADAVVLRCEMDRNAPPQSTVDVLLALPRPKVLKRLWAQLAALGVGRILLTNADKVERYYFDSHVLDSGFYTPLLIEGLQQAGDTMLPEVRVVKELKPFLEDELDSVFPKTGTRLIADPSGKQMLFHALAGDEVASPGRRVLLAIGPEGGWTAYELEMFRSRGFTVVGLGPRILRTDTACVALLSWLTLHSALYEQ